MILFLLANLAGLAAFTWPLLVGAGPTGESSAHAVDAPVLVALLIPLFALTAVQEARSRRGDARFIALLAALVAVNAFLRIPKGPTGEGLVFVLPILAGWYLGARFAFLLGAFTMLVSAVLTGGVGPWLPFQMLALGWVGAGAALARRATGGRAPVPVLGAYAYASSLLYGFAMTLWFWPFLAPAGDLSFVPGIGFAETLTRYARFWMVTSLPWDAGRALLVNVPLVVVLARPVGALLERAASRFAPEVRFAPPVPRAAVP